MSFSKRQSAIIATTGAVVLGLGAAAALGKWLGEYIFDRKKSLPSVIQNPKWFSEVSKLWVGQAFSLEVKEVLVDKASRFQRIQVFDCGDVWGRVLVLDGAIQLTEKDQHAYHEMMAHVPMLSHPKPQRILVVGGGDGGVVSELVKHPQVELIQLCEIDTDVMEVSKEFFPALGQGLDDPRVRVHTGDGFDFLREYSTSKQPPWDVIIVDCGDPVGPAGVLFTRKFYQFACQSLSSRGILCCQGECMWLHAKIIEEMAQHAGTFFPVVEYCQISIPSYPCGNIGLLCCNKSAAGSCKRALRELTPSGDMERADTSTSTAAPDSTSSPSRDGVGEYAKGLRYYSKSMHSAAFVLPVFAQGLVSPSA